MTRTLEPPNGSNADWDVLYVARGSGEVVGCRPVFTGDVFGEVKVFTPKGEPKTKTVLVRQHPCAMRPDGVELADSILVAEVRRHSLIVPEKWKGFGKLIPLPDLLPEVGGNKRHQAAFFDSTYHTDADALLSANRIACLSLLGVNILLQRWVYHSTRLVAPTYDINLVTSHVYEEAELIEEWCDEAMQNGESLDEALEKVTEWLSEVVDGKSRRQRLENEQLRSHMRREARKASRL